MLQVDLIQDIYTNIAENGDITIHIKPTLFSVISPKESAYIVMDYITKSLQIPLVNPTSVATDEEDEEIICLEFDLDPKI